MTVRPITAADVLPLRVAVARGLVATGIAPGPVLEPYAADLGHGRHLHTPGSCDYCASTEYAGRERWQA